MSVKKYHKHAGEDHPFSFNEIMLNNYIMYINVTLCEFDSRLRSWLPTLSINKHKPIKYVRHIRISNMFKNFWDSRY